MSTQLALVRARKQLLDRIAALRQRLDALEPVVSADESAHWLQDMGESLEQCVLSLDHLVTARPTKVSKPPSPTCE